MQKSQGATTKGVARRVFEGDCKEKKSGGPELKFVDDVSVDACKDNLYKPKLRAADRDSMSVLLFWLLFFRSEGICEILQEKKERLKSSMTSC